MGKLWIFLICVTVAAVSAQQDGDSYSDYELDYIDDMYNIDLDEKDLDNVKDAASDIADAVIPDADNSVSGEEDDLPKAKTGDKNQFEDYQIEDNRSEVKDEPSQKAETPSAKNYDEKTLSDDTELKEAAKVITEEVKEVKDEGEEVIKEAAELASAGDDNNEPEIKEQKLSEDHEGPRVGDDVQLGKDEKGLGEDEGILQEEEKRLQEGEEQLEEEVGYDNEQPEDIEGDAGQDVPDNDEDAEENNESKEIDAPPVSDPENKELIEETRAILEEDKSNDFADDKVAVQKSNVNDVIEETKKILQETNDAFDEDTNDKKNYVDEAAQDVVNMAKNTKNTNNAADFIDKAYDDLNEDLEKLMETWKKLNSEVGSEKNTDDAVDPYLRDGDKPASSINNEGLVEDKSPMAELARSTLTTKSNNQYEEKENEKPEVDELFKDGPEIDGAVDGNDDTINDEEFSNSEDSIDKVGDVIPQEKALDEKIFEYSDVQDMKNTNDTENSAAKTAIPYLADALSNEVSNKMADEIKKMNVTDLSPEQYDQLMKQFQVLHKDELDISKNDAGRNIATINIHLKLDEETVVTSPNFPRPYPTNNIIDWRFTGEGVGIEMNITDFFVNGVLGDYLLVKPGGVDASGNYGLVFSYRLRSPRAYRFLDVDQMFVRFEARPGMAFTTGFSFTVKMIAPRADIIEDLPEPEPQLPSLNHTMTLFMGGVTLQEFRSNEEEFRLLIADMATLYINANGLDHGLNTTDEVTQIQYTRACRINWPGYEHCAEVSFGVPLVYDEDDERAHLTGEELRDMWQTYSVLDPFASRLRRMGLKEFLTPDDGGVLTIWLVVAFGVLVSMIMLALALWRFSCFENYTRMPTYSDRDSVYSEKRGLDLYPTPHQTLPPLYAENDYKWDDPSFEDSTRVDMGGFTNKSYSRDMYDMESDDEVIPPRDSSGNFSPRGVCEV